jgi:hypothetical protein
VIARLVGRRRRRRALEYALRWFAIEGTRGELWSVVCNVETYLKTGRTPIDR